MVQMDFFFYWHKIKMSNLHGNVLMFAIKCLDNGWASYQQSVKGIPWEHLQATTSIFFHKSVSKNFWQQEEPLAGTKCVKKYLSCRATGKNDKLWLVSEAKDHHSFPKYASNLWKQCIYKHNSNGWMTSSLFVKHLN